MYLDLSTVGLYWPRINLVVLPSPTNSKSLFSLGWGAHKKHTNSFVYIRKTYSRKKTNDPYLIFHVQTKTPVTSVLDDVYNMNTLHNMVKKQMAVSSRWGAEQNVTQCGESQPKLKRKSVFVPSLALRNLCSQNKWKQTKRLRSLLYLHTTPPTIRYLLKIEDIDALPVISGSRRYTGSRAYAHHSP